jgi:arylsulfatase
MSGSHRFAFQTLLFAAVASSTSIAGAGSVSVSRASRAPQGRVGARSKPNIIVIIGDDIGWFNIGGRTPNLDRLAAEGKRFTDYYAEASCTAGRANFIVEEAGRAQLDDVVGAVMKKLKDTGLDESTIVVFTTPPPAEPTSPRS